MREWLREYGLEPTHAVTAADVELFRTAREALHGDDRVGAERRASGRGGRAGAHPRAGGGPPDRRPNDSGGLTVTRPGTAAEALARLCAGSREDLAGTQREHLHAGGDDTCSGIFLDYTGRRRWCSDERCGNRLRVRAHRARTAQASSTDGGW